jgi:predicted nuclease with TOPRIM domain
MYKRPEKNDSSNVKKIDDSPTRIKVLEDQLLKLGKFASQLKEMVAQRDQEIMHLKALLEKAVPLIGSASPLFITDEEQIALQQMDRFKRISEERQMTLEEIKAFDLLVKNKRLAQKQPTMIPYTPEKKKEPTQAELISIAETVSLLDEEIGTDNN